MIRTVHKTAALGALALIATFFLSTAAVELFGSHEAIAFVKRSIWYGIFLLIPLMAAAGISGTLLAKGRRAPEVARKRRRMPLIALNGVVVLVPAAYWLDTFASRGDFSSLFYTLQGVELLFGGLNIFLMIKNVRDGRKVSQKNR